MKAMINLRLGKTKEVIEMLEEVADPIRISRQNDLLLIQAYQVAGEIRKGRSYTQISLYLYLIGTVFLSGSSHLCDAWEKGGSTGRASGV